MLGGRASDSSGELSLNKNYSVNVFRRIYGVTQLTMEKIKN